MKPIAIIEAQRPGLDSVILWEQDENRTVAFAYLDGHVMMTRPLTGDTLDQAISEIAAAFQINDAQLTRVHQWPTRDVQARRVLQTPARWQQT